MRISDIRASIEFNRPALIIIARREAEAIAREAHLEALYPEHLSLSGMSIDGIPITVADIERSVTINHDLTVRLI